MASQIFPPISGNVWGGRPFPSLLIPSQRHQRFTPESGYFEGETQQSGWTLLSLSLNLMTFLPAVIVWEKMSSPNSPWNIPSNLQLPLCQQMCPTHSDTPGWSFCRSKSAFFLTVIKKKAKKKYPVKPQHHKGIPFSASLTQGQI